MNNIAQKERGVLSENKQSKSLNDLLYFDYKSFESKKTLQKKLLQRFKFNTGTFHTYSGLDTVQLPSKYDYVKHNNYQTDIKYSGYIAKITTLQQLRTFTSEASWG